MGTPGVKPSSRQLMDDQPLEAKLHSPYRAVAARANYLSADRPEAQYAAKECCRWMSAPTDLAMAGLKRLGRYLEGSRRLVMKYPWQSSARIGGYSDIDRAGCGKTR